MARRRIIRRRRRVVRKTVRKFPPYRRRVYNKTPMLRTVGPPGAMCLRLRYVSNYQASVAASTLLGRQFCLNSLYDPDVSGTGGQPYYYDQLTNLYNRYRVYGCKVQIQFTCSSSVTNLYPPRVAMVAFGDVFPSWSTMATIQNQKGAYVKTIIPGQTTAIGTRYYSCHKLLDVSRVEYDTSEPFQAVVAASPTRTCNLNFYVQNQDGANAITVDVWLMMTFYCKMFDLVEPVAS